MKRKLLRQISNEWKSNVWLCIELLIVSVVMWYLVDIFFTNISIYNEPRGFDVSHCYLINQRVLSTKSPDYNEEIGRRAEDFEELFNALKARPDVEAIAGGFNSYFYNGSNSGGQINHDELKIPTDRYNIRRWVTPDFPIVFRLRGSKGESSEELARLLRDNPDGVIFSSNMLGPESKASELRNHIGDVFDVSGDSLPLVGVFQTARYDDFRSGYSSPSYLKAVPLGWVKEAELVVRVKEKMDDGFAERLMKDAENYRFGNFYIASVKSFDEIRTTHQRHRITKLIHMGVASVFLAINIFLGILGTFWFRTRQRMSEIALRMACGAPRKSVFSRVITEGELLLLLVTPVAMVFDWLLTKYEFNTYYNGGYFVAYRFFACVVITWALLAIMIYLGSLLPARRAMQTAPAVALKDE